MCVCVCRSHVVVHEGASQGRSRLQPAELGRSARRVEAEHVRLLDAILGRTVLGGVGLHGTALGRCPGEGVSDMDVAKH